MSRWLTSILAGAPSIIRRAVAGAILVLCCWPTSAMEPQAAPLDVFPRSLSSYGTSSGQSLLKIIIERIAQEPLNLVATIIFVLAIIHTFLAPFFTKLAHRIERKHQNRIAQRPSDKGANDKEEVSFSAEILHFLGEVEAVFGIWVIPLMLAWVLFKDWTTAKHYLNSGVNFTEPLFIVVIMAMSASRPILRLAESVLATVAAIGKGSPAAWWVSILTLGPLLGSFVTEPAAMTISALLLAQKFYERKPSPTFAYATLGLLFVNISVGGTLTHFAAPPVLMVAGKWGWDTPFMMTHIGWKAVVGILVANLGYFLWFRRQFGLLARDSAADSEMSGGRDERAIPMWVTLVHIVFMAWTVANSHSPVLFIGGFLFYLAFTQATEHHQHGMNLRTPMLAPMPVRLCCQDRVDFIFGFAMFVSVFKQSGPTAHRLTNFSGTRASSSLGQRMGRYLFYSLLD